MNIRNILLPGILAASSLLAGCASHAYVAAYLPGPPPQPYVVGAVGYAPAPGYVWADGFWDLRGGRWVWAPGYWVRAPHRRAHWAPAHWVQTNHGWRRVEGRWR
ncbi:MAG: YXWGXW repeat-containing protein [Bryobacteraceae bacterium]|jgi:hypothetical protein